MLIEDNDRKHLLPATIQFLCETRVFLSRLQGDREASRYSSAWTASSGVTTMRRPKRQVRARRRPEKRGDGARTRCVGKLRAGG